MNLQEILEEISEKYPHGLTTSSIVRKLNNLQRKLFRTVVKRTVVDAYDLFSGAALYPITFHPSIIREVLVNGVKIEYRQLEGDATSRFFYILDDAIGLYPTPDKDAAGGLVIYRYQDPKELSESDLLAVPDLDEAFHSLLIYGVCKELAEIDQHFDLASGFVMQYNAEMDLYIDASQDTEPAQIQEERWW